MRLFHCRDRALGALSLAFALSLGAGCEESRLEPKYPVNSVVGVKRPYAASRLEIVDKMLTLIRDKYSDPSRVKPKQMLRSALISVGNTVDQVIVLDADPSTLTIRVEDSQMEIRVDDVESSADVLAKLRKVFAFLEERLRGAQVNLRKAEFAAGNGILDTLDPSSVLVDLERRRVEARPRAAHSAGFGSIVSIRDQRLTIMGVMPGSAAKGAGLKRYDRITKINDQPTLNMTLDDAVGLLSGEPGTTATLWIAREGEGGWQGEKPFDLIREIIDIKSVEARPLEGDIGYVRLKQIQPTSVKELVAALGALRKKGPRRGLVLDLRDTAGSQFKQAVIIAEHFLIAGTIATVVRRSVEREVIHAHGPGTEPPYPIVVLVNQRTASAGEIVAAALKDLDRAVIVGSQTAGEIRTQEIFDELNGHEAALGLTTWQVLAPSGAPIDGVGITPDVELHSMTVDELEMDLTGHKDNLSDSDIDADGARPLATPRDKPSEVLRYQLTTAERDRARERDHFADAFDLDFSVRFARDLAQRMQPNAKRPEQLRATHDYIEQVRKDELSKVTAELAKLGIDWSDAPGGAAGGMAAPGDLEIKVEMDKAEVNAGEPMELRVTVKNNGKQPVYRLRATTESQIGYFDHKELVFGKIAPGQSRTAKAGLGWCDIQGRELFSVKPKSPNAVRTCKIPRNAHSRSDGVRVVFDTAGGPPPSPVEVRPTIKALDRPDFQYSYQIVDDRAGNGDGRAHKGEQLTMYLTVKNAGKGRSYNAQVNLANRSGEGLLLGQGRVDISDMKPGDVRNIALTFDVRQQLADPEARLLLSLVDLDLGEVVSEDVKVPIEPAISVARFSGALKVGAQGAVLLPAPKGPEDIAFGKLLPGVTLSAVGKAGSRYKVDLGAGRFAFVLGGEVAAGEGPVGGPPVFEAIYSHPRPVLDVQAATMATRDEKVKVTGVASADERLMDVLIFVGKRKVYYKSNQGADPKKATFELDVPLGPGVNVISVVARETRERWTRRVLIVRRDGVDGSLLKTPTNSREGRFVAHP